MSLFENNSPNLNKAVIQKILSNLSLAVIVLNMVILPGKTIMADGNLPWECGPTAMIIKPQGGGKWWISSSNIVLFPFYASASTSGTSECSSSASAMNQKDFEHQKYLYATWDILSEEMYG